MKAIKIILPVKYGKHSYYTNVSINGTKLDTIFKPSDIEPFFGTAVYTQTNLPFVSRKEGEEFDKETESSYYFAAILEEDKNNAYLIETDTCSGYAILFDYKGDAIYAIDGPKYSCAGEQVRNRIEETSEWALKAARDSFMANPTAENIFTRDIDEYMYFLIAYDNVDNKYILTCDKLENADPGRYKDNVGILYLGNDFLACQKCTEKRNEVKVVVRHWLRSINGEKGIMLITALFDPDDGRKLTHCYEPNAVSGVYYNDVMRICYERDVSVNTVPYVVEYAIKNAIEDYVKRLIHEQIEGCAFAIKVGNICNYTTRIEYPTRSDVLNPACPVVFEEIENVL